MVRVCKRVAQEQRRAVTIWRFGPCSAIGVAKIADGISVVYQHKPLATIGEVAAVFPCDPGIQGVPIANAEGGAILHYQRACSRVDETNTAGSEIERDPLGETHLCQIQRNASN